MRFLIVWHWSSSCLIFCQLLLISNTKKNIVFSFILKILLSSCILQTVWLASYETPDGVTFDFLLGNLLHRQALHVINGHSWQFYLSRALFSESDGNDEQLNVLQNRLHRYNWWFLFIGANRSKPFIVICTQTIIWKLTFRF